MGGVSACVYAWRFRRVQLGPLVMLGGWFVAGAVVFSYSSGIVHTYYLSALAPATSALVGIGTVSLARDAKRGGRGLTAPLLAVMFTAWLELALLRRTGYESWLQSLVVFAAFIAAAAIVALAVGPDWSAAPRRVIASGALADRSRRLPRATGRVVGDRASGRGERCLPRCRAELHLGPRRLVVDARPRLRRWRLRLQAAGATRRSRPRCSYVEAHGATSRFPLIVTSEQEAAPYVIAGEPVASMGGFTGRETVLTHAFLAKLIRSGEARYFLLGGGGGFGGGPGGGSNTAVQTIESTCTSVSAVSGLYDCAGKADAILAAG